MKKSVALFLTGIIALCCFTGCKFKKIQVRICTSGNMGEVPLVYIMQDAENEEAKNDYSFSNFDSPLSVVSKLAGDNCDIAVVPGYYAAVLNRKTGGKIKVLRTVPLGGLVFLENGNEIKGLENLDGKTVYYYGRDTYIEVIVKTIMKKNKISYKNVKFERIPDAETIEKNLLGGVSPIVIVNQPLGEKLKQNQTVREVVDIEQKWNETFPDANMVNNCVIVREKFLNSNISAVQKFLEEYDNSYKKVIADYEAAGTLCAKYVEGNEKRFIVSSLKEEQDVKRSQSRMKNDYFEFLSVMYKAKKSSIGGKMPDKSFFYEK